MDSDEDVVMGKAPQLLPEGEERMFHWQSDDSGDEDDDVRPTLDEHYFGKAVSELVKDIQETTFEDPTQPRFQPLFKEVHEWTRQHAYISLTTELSKDPVETS
ncbi:hypothetical protein HYALB_00011401 [Hymenoscyphus albidus]|uniref:Uncharacterized protein n=1 Tax=Hymenoscyphus albidus TaxID=595503 RepID=A0A9N9LH80_9HELO|nr:hypothetical protein HYALB_00011401 [Hymenoscyphus albidus]